jgi:hypothetical protein
MNEKLTWGLRHFGHAHPPLWWRPDSDGYTTDISDAGLFNEEFAKRQRVRRTLGE